MNITPLYTARTEDRLEILLQYIFPDAFHPPPPLFCPLLLSGKQSDRWKTVPHVSSIHYSVLFWRVFCSFLYNGLLSRFPLFQSSLKGFIDRAKKAWVICLRYAVMYHLLTCKPWKPYRLHLLHDEDDFIQNLKITLIVNWILIPGADVLKHV